MIQQSMTKSSSMPPPPEAPDLLDLPAPPETPVGYACTVRIVPGVLWVAASCLLALGVWFTPSPRGLGTHQQLGLPGCGFLARTGVPCVTCGVTTSFTYASHGRMFRSLGTQPLGTVLGVFTAMVWLVSGYALVVGISLGPLGRWLWRPTQFWAVAVLVLVAWAYKILVVRGVV